MTALTPDEFIKKQKTDRILSKINKFLSTLLCVAVINLILMFFNINLIGYFKIGINYIVSSETVKNVSAEVVSFGKNIAEEIKELLSDRDGSSENIG